MSSGTAPSLVSVSVERAAVSLGGKSCGTGRKLLLGLDWMRTTPSSVPPSAGGGKSCGLGQKLLLGQDRTRTTPCSAPPPAGGGNQTRQSNFLQPSPAARGKVRPPPPPPETSPFHVSVEYSLLFDLLRFGRCCLLCRPARFAACFAGLLCGSGCAGWLPFCSACWLYS